MSAGVGTGEQSDRLVIVRRAQGDSVATVRIPGSVVQGIPENRINFSQVGVADVRGLISRKPYCAGSHAFAIILFCFLACSGRVKCRLVSARACARSTELEH